MVCGLWALRSLLLVANMLTVINNDLRLNGRRISQAISTRLVVDKLISWCVPLFEYWPLQHMLLTFTVPLQHLNDAHNAIDYTHELQDTRSPLTLQRTRRNHQEGTYELSNWASWVIWVYWMGRYPFRVMDDGWKENDIGCSIQKIDKWTLLCYLLVTQNRI
jgi:hypothetical protein